jgi:subtilisin-like proprotein convertase family protein
MRSRKPVSARPRPQPIGLVLEVLEDRFLMTAGLVVPDYLAQVTSDGSVGPVGLSPAQLRNAYGFNSIQFSNGVVGTGSGQTIAIIDAYDDPNIAGDLHAFDSAFGLADPPSFKKVNESGGTALPAANSSWALEISLDVEWAHALAPQANILLVEANSASYSDLLTAVDYAKAQTGVSVVSMSWGGGEFNGETSLDSTFTSPASHGVTFVASAGDNGIPGGYPAFSSRVLAVGGTSLSLSASGAYAGESAWSDSGGGVSQYEAKPSYQSGEKLSSTMRTAPDVSFDANPASGVAVYDSYGASGGAWIQVGGTSLSAPSWAALIAIADQGRALVGQGSLDGYSQTLPMLYSLPSSDFNTLGGYSLQTGLGTPKANLIANGLISPTTPPTPPAPPPAPPAPPAPPPAPTPPTTTYQGPSIGIAPYTQSWSGLVVPTNFLVTTVTVQVNLTYPSDGDLAIYLVSPAGRVIELAYHNGGSGQNYTSTIFADAGSTSIASGSAPFNGTYRPESPLSVFAGKNAKGTWWLVVEDDGRTGSGKLLSWSLSLQGTAGGGAGSAPALLENEPTAGLVSTNPVPQAQAAVATLSTPTQPVNLNIVSVATDQVFTRTLPEQAVAPVTQPSLLVLNALFGTGRFGSFADGDALDLVFPASEDQTLLA